MGKKKVATETTEEALKASAKTEKAELKAATSGAASKRIDSGRVYIKSSYNNTVITVTDAKGDVIAWGTSGSLGFSGPKKATPFAASKVVGAIAEKLKKSGPVDVHVYVDGVGGGRDSALRSLLNHGFNVLSIRDITPVPHNGPKPCKVRRI